MLTTTRLDILALAGLAAILGTAVMLPLPRTIQLPDRPAMRAWSEQLDRDMGPVMADCVRYEILGRVAPRDLEVMLANTGGDPAVPAVLRIHTGAAIDRCSRRHFVE